MADSYDVIVIGSGAGGGTLVHRLAPTGKKILLLERGGYVPREKDNWEPRAVNLEGKYQTKEIWKDRNGDDLHPHTNCRGRQHQVLWRGPVPAAQGRLRRDSPSRRHFTRVAHLVRRARAVLRPRRAHVSRARRARRRPYRPA